MRGHARNRGIRMQGKRRIKKRIRLGEKDLKKKIKSRLGRIAWRRSFSFISKIRADSPVYIYSFWPLPCPTLTEIQITIDTLFINDSTYILFLAFS